MIKHMYIHDEIYLMTKIANYNIIAYFALIFPEVSC